MMQEAIADIIVNQDDPSTWIISKSKLAENNSLAPVPVEKISE